MIPNGGAFLLALLMSVSFASSQLSPTHICTAIISDYFGVTFFATVKKDGENALFLLTVFIACGVLRHAADGGILKKTPSRLVSSRWSFSARAVSCLTEIDLRRKCWKPFRTRENDGKNASSFAPFPAPLPLNEIRVVERRTEKTFRFDSPSKTSSDTNATAFARLCRKPSAEQHHRKEAAMVMSIFSSSFLC